MAHAQSMHSDIRFAYDAGKIAIDTNVGNGVGVGEFAVDGLFRQFETNPGFASENDVGFGIQPSDFVVYNVLDDLLFWNGSDFVPPNAGTQVRIENNGSSDTLVHGTSQSMPGSFTPPANSIGQADQSGDFHAHVDFFLEPNNAPAPPPLPELGAYGLELSLSTNAAGIADSDPFFIVFNFGLDGEQLEEAVGAFAGLITASLPGDYNVDGVVDARDYAVWRSSYGAMGSDLSADGNGNGAVDAADYTVWRDNYGAASASAAHVAGRVPEPGAAWLAAVVLLGLMLDRSCFAWSSKAAAPGGRSCREEVAMV